MKGLKENSEEQKVEEKNKQNKKELDSKKEKEQKPKNAKSKKEEKETKEKNKKPKDTKKTEKEERNEEKKEKKKEDKKVKEKKDEKKFQQVEKNPKKFQNAVEKMMEYRKKKILVPICILFIAIVVILFCSTIFALVNMNNQKMMSGISISGIDVSGLSKEEATAKINTVYQEKLEKDIEIKYEEYTNTLNPTLLEVNYDVDKAIDNAYSIGKKDNIFINNYEILFSLITKKNINVEMTLNEDVAKQTIEDIGVNLPGIIIESSYAIEDNELIITKGKAGIAINSEELLNKVKDRLNDINSREDYIEIPVIQKNPEAIDIDKIHEEVYKEAKDAYFVKEPFTLYPEVEGIDFDVNAAKELLKEEKEEYVIPLIISKPKVTLSQIGSEAFPEQLSTFTTRYDVSDTNRSTNLVVACQKINGKVILAGETFSYNQTLGPRTIAAGYRTGKVYSGGQVVDGIGGGICQISSTLYNAVLMANLEIVERKNHQFVTGYLPAGRDATVSYGLIDFKFKNTRQYPVRIVASAKNGIATVSIYGIKEENEYTFTFSTRTVASIPFSTKYEEDASLPTGTEKVKQKGVNGLKTETYITKILNGKVISTTLLSRDTYDSMTRVIVRGKASTQNNEVNIDNKDTKKENKNDITKNTTNVNNTTKTKEDQNNKKVNNKNGT